MMIMTGVGAFLHKLNFSSAVVLFCFAIIRIYKTCLFQKAVEHERTVRKAACK